jgi:hypothetical protein
MVCGALVNVHTGVVSRLYGLEGSASSSSSSSSSSAVAATASNNNPASKYLIVKYEDLLEEPRVLAARIVQWAGVPLTSVSTAVGKESKETQQGQHFFVQSELQLEPGDQDLVCRTHHELLESNWTIETCFF